MTPCVSARIGSSCGSSYFTSVFPCFLRHPVVHHPAPERSRTIQGIQRDQIFEAVGLGAPKQVAHARALELEDAVGRPIGKEFVRLRVVQRHIVYVEVDSFSPLDLGERVADERERAQSQEVHLQQTDAIDFLHVPLRGDLVPGSLVQRRVVGYGPWRNHHAGRMH